MPTLSWSPGLQAEFQTTLDSYINNLFGRPCTLFFPPVQTNTPGEVDYWAAGNPLPIHTQQPGNPYTDGRGYKAVESTGTIIMVVYWKSSQFDASFPKGSRYPEGVIRTRGFISDLNQVLNCTKMETYLDIPTDHHQFKLTGEPTPTKLVPGRYFYALWERL